MQKNQNPSQQKRPNVLFLLTDDQRYGTIGALGNEEIKTPNMDRLVRSGTSFINAHIPGGTVSAVCMPSRAMLHSGKTLFHLKECGKNIPEDQVTMCQSFLNAGYHTAGIGKWHNGVASYARSFDNGANIFFGGMWDHWNVPVNDFKPDGIYEKEIQFTPNFTQNEVPVTVRAERIHAGVHSTELFTGSAVKYIEEYGEEQPFFMYLSFLAPHDPRTMPEEFRNMYDPEKISLPPNYLPMPAVTYGWAAKGRDENTESYPRRPEKIRQHIADYYAMISHIDSCIGRVLAALEKRDMLEDTIIVLCGDNGLAIGQHGLMGKQNLYEHSVKVPLVFAGPGVPKDQVNDKYVYLLDIYPTLCEICGIPVPSTVEGRSFAELFTDTQATIREDLYLAFQARIRGVISGKYKLLEYRTQDIKMTQLFDLENDPWERYNLFDMAGTEEIVANLREKLFALRDEWGDETMLFGQQYWQQWRQYEAAEVKGVARPMGGDMRVQVDSWGTAKK
ncbi:MAG: sulfatase-like hydrolase/transferase [Lachnospiraceae bacterium]|nr:sulfatase-like hydrolase/transferase [Lachnospiraceae bacterium]